MEEKTGNETNPLFRECMLFIVNLIYSTHTY